MLDDTTGQERPGSRWPHAVIAASCLSGVAVELWGAYRNETMLPPEAGFSRTYGPGLDGMLNQLSFFTTESNGIVGTTSLLLALQPERQSDVFHAMRLAGLVDLSVTGLVWNLLLAKQVEFEGVRQLANIIEHMINPTLALAGWALIGPPAAVTPRRLALAVAVPLAWTGATLLRGAVVQWYPYTILDVARLGYAPVTRNVVAVVVVALLIAGALAATDRRLGPVRRWVAARLRPGPLHRSPLQPTNGRAEA